MTRTTILVALSLAASSLAACSVPFEIETLDSFVELEENRYSRYDYRATTADGVVISVRALDNDRRGTLDFWTQAVRTKLRDGRGYALLEEEDIRTRGGVRGKQMRFGRDESGHTYRYWVTLFVRHAGRNPRVWIIESGGEEAAFNEHRDELGRMIQGFGVK